MKSRLFSGYDPNAKDAEDFSRDLRATLELSEEHLSQCLRTFPEMRRAGLKRVRDAFFKDLEQRTELSRLCLKQALSVMGFFVDHLLGDDKREIRRDTAQEWADDLEHLKVIESNHRTAFLGLAADLVATASSLERERLRREAEAGVLPVFRSCGVTIERRAVQEDIYHWGEPIDDYQPEMVDSVNIISVHIGFDGGDPSDVYFQMAEQHVDYLIDQLVAAKKDLVAFNRFLEQSRGSRRGQG
ncbi:MAG: hypothetical protein IH830_02280 [Planctomycetes bacterium]|nr:hypothetical protein [Planctomycetota bacterium]